MHADRHLPISALALALALTLTPDAHPQSVQTTTVQGTVYQANGSPASGTLQITWPAFTTAAGQAIAAGRTTVTIPATGQVSAALAPNIGASPAGLYYTAVYHLSDGSTSTEYWVVPNSLQATIAQVRATVMPAAQAVQAVSKAYVDQSIQQAVQSQITPSGGTLTGPLYLHGDPAQPAEAADKHYVDQSAAGALPILGGVLQGPLTAPRIGAVYQADQFPGADFGAQLQACLNALDPTYGGTCDARNFPGSVSMAASLNFASPNVTVYLPCSTIATAASILVPAGTRNVTLHGCASRGTSAASGSQGGTVFLYSGAAALLQVGDPSFAADTKGFHLDNAALNTTAASAATAQAIALYRTQEISLSSLYLLGNPNQTALTLDGTGNYTGGTLSDLQFTGYLTALNATGHTVDNPATTDWLNASTLLRLHIDCPTLNGNPIPGTTGINLQSGDGNTVTGGDIESCSTALHLGSHAQNNTILGLRNENNSTQIQADPGSSYNNWITGGTMFTGKLSDNGTRNSFLDTFHRSFNALNGDWYGSQQDATVTNHFRLGIGTGAERGLLNRYQTDYGYRWTTGISDASAGEQFYQVLDELNSVYRLSIGQYNHDQASANNQTVLNAAGTGAVIFNGSNNSGTGGVVFGSGGPSSSTVATIDKSGNAHFTGTLLIDQTAQSTGTLTVRNNADSEVDYYLWPGATTSQKGSFTYKDFNGSSQWFLLKDAANNFALNSATGGLDSFKAYQSTNSGDTYINASNSTGHIRLNYETGSGSETDIYSGSSTSLAAAFLNPTAIKFPGLAAAIGSNCLQIDTSGYLTNSGAPCASGTGTVGAGNTGQIAYYTANGTTIAGTTTVPLANGGTGATTAAAALASLGALPLSGGTLTGPITATQFNGPVTGNVTGNVSGNLTGNVTGNVTGTAANVTGTVALANGGTGATTAAAALSNLGALPLSGGTLAGPITATQFNGPVTGNVTGDVSGNLTGNVTGNVSGTAANVTGTVALANGGTGATTAAAALSNLGALPLSGGTLTGPITATQFNGPVSGNVTGDVFGNLTGNVTGNVSGTATNVTGTVALANGGTGATTAVAALTSLGALPAAGGTLSGNLTIKNNANAEVDYILQPGSTASQKGAFTWKDYNGASEWYLLKDASNNLAINSAIGGLDSFKSYQSSNSGDTYLNAANATGHIRLNYESGSGAETDIYSGSSTALAAAFLSPTSIKLPGLAAASGHNCLQIDNSGYLANTAAPCATGTVNSGTTGQIAYYNAAGATVSGLTSVPLTAGGTGATTAAAALSNLGALPLSGGTLTGPLTATQFNGPVSGNVTGNVIGSLTGNVTGDVAGNLTGRVTFPDTSVQTTSQQGALTGSANDATARTAATTAQTAAATAETDAQSGITAAAAAQTTANTAQTTATTAETDAQSGITAAAAAQTAANSALNGQANDSTARTAATTAQTSAATAETDAQSGITAAAAAQTSANAAQTSAATAETDAQSGITAAAAAQTAANSALNGQANDSTARTAATTAQTSAATAESDAQSGITAAAAAQTAANSALNGQANDSTARTAATTAQTAAATAETDAQSGITAAAAAQTSANAAQTSAATAETDAQSGITAAAAAQTAANSALNGQAYDSTARTAATSAQTSAATAETDAQSGITAAAAAQTTANAAQAALTALESSLDDEDDEVSEAKATATAAKSSADQAETDAQSGISAAAAAQTNASSAQAAAAAAETDAQTGITTANAAQTTAQAALAATTATSSGSGANNIVTFPGTVTAPNFTAGSATPVKLGDTGVTYPDGTTQASNALADIIVDKYLTTADGHSGQDYCYAVNQAVASVPAGSRATLRATWGPKKVYSTCKFNKSVEMYWNGSYLLPQCTYDAVTNPNAAWCAPPLVIPGVTVSPGTTQISLPAGTSMSQFQVGMRVGGVGIPQGSFINCVGVWSGASCSASGTTITLSLNPSLDFTGSTTSGNTTVRGVAMMNGLAAGMSVSASCNTVSISTRTISNLHYGGSSATDTQGFDLSSATGVLTCTPAYFTAQSSWTADLTFQAVAPVVVWENTRNGMEDAENFMLGAAEHDLYITDPQGWRVSHGIEGEQIIGLDGFKSFGARIIAIDGAARILGGYMDTATVQRFLQSTRENSFFDYQMYDDGELATGQAVDEIMTGAAGCPGNCYAGTDEINTIGFHGDIIAWPHGYGDVIGTYNSTNWGTDNGPRLLEFNGNTQREGGFHTNGTGSKSAYVYAPADMVLIYAGKTSTWHQALLQGGGYGHFVVRDLNGANMTFSGGTFGTGGGSLQYTVSVTGGSSTVTFVGGGDGSGFPGNDYPNGKGMILSTPNEAGSPCQTGCNVYLATTNAISADTHTITLAAPFQGTNATTYPDAVLNYGTGGYMTYFAAPGMGNAYPVITDATFWTPSAADLAVSGLTDLSQTFQGMSIHGMTYKAVFGLSYQFTYPALFSGPVNAYNGFVASNGAAVGSDFYSFVQTNAGTASSSSFHGLSDKCTWNLSGSNNTIACLYANMTTTGSAYGTTPRDRFLFQLQLNSADKYGIDLNGLQKLSLGTAIASASGIAPIAPITHVTGTAAISTITVPSAVQSWTGCLKLIPDGAFTTTTTGNIAQPSTAVPGKVLEECYDGVKWYPSY